MGSLKWCKNGCFKDNTPDQKSEWRDQGWLPDCSWEWLVPFSFPTVFLLPSCLTTSSAPLISIFFFSFGVHSKFCSLPSSCRMYLSSLLCISSKINTGLDNNQKLIPSFNFSSFSDALIPNDLSSARGRNSICNTVRFHSQCLLSLLPSSYSSTWHLAHLMSIHLVSSYLTC